MKKIILFFLLLTVTTGNSQTIQKGWNCFEGYIGINDIVVNVYCDSVGNLKGDYCYKKYETRIPLIGKLKPGSLFLDEFTDNKITAKFNGTINEKDNTIGGKWSSTTHSDIHFHLKLSSQSGSNSFEKRYAVGTKESVELFFKKAKVAILSDDKTWLSKNTEYPLTLSSNKSKLKIKNAQDFIKKYKQIITPAFKQTIKETCTCNIFSNWRGAMIANGFLWINEFEKGKLKITAIH
ncbi:MAG TPA: hypothetical protein PKN96_05265 [Flavobacterium sp.]|uniref:hypothetical protein n=1 Tax=Flavobacterium sp. TaxID=239 RepID=UPI002CE9B4CE|nr:hypothetical protein [Flavobacterium sp.]HNP32681.1 hypothetical protein [Flavobacterium sp.]